MTKPTIRLDDLIRLNPGGWLETHGYIRDNNGHSVRPRLNVLQRRINALYVQRQMHERPLRAILVKPRKRGASTMVAACHYSQLQNWKHEGVIIANKLETSDVIFRMMVVFQETDEFKGKWGGTAETTSEKMRFSHGSILHQATAQGKATVRGFTPQFIHGTESAHWDNAKECMDDVMNAVPGEGFNCVFLESTPFGSGTPFALTWDRARWPRADECPGGRLYWKQWEGLCPDTGGDGTGLDDLKFVRIFAAWFEFEESRIVLSEAQKQRIKETIDAEASYAGEQALIDTYGNEGPQGLRLGNEVTKSDVWEQLAWRRITIENSCRGSTRIFDEEHPRDPKSAFLASGRAVFDEDAVAAMAKRAALEPREPGVINEGPGGVAWTKTLPEEANFWVWEPPTIGCRYLLGVDLAEGEDQTKGEDPDRHSALVYRDEYLSDSGLLHPVKLVARVRPPNRMPIVPFTKLVWLLSHFYGKCLVIPEMNNTGLAFMVALRALPDPPVIWQRREIDPHSGRERTWDGWRTTDRAEYGGVRSSIIWQFHDRIRKGTVEILCPHVVAELADFVDKSGRMEAGRGHDDDVICSAMTLSQIGSATPYLTQLRELPRDIADLYADEEPHNMAMRW